jgi:amidohydrolase
VPGGALDVLADDGLVDVSSVIGLHCEPKLDCGTIGLRAGAITSAADMITIDLSGPGGHTARPELTVDLVSIGARLVTDVPALVAAELVRNGHDDGAVKLVFGAIHAGDAANVIPTDCRLKASVRTPSLEVWENLEKIVTVAVDGVLDGTGAARTIEYVHGVPPTVNDPEVIERLRHAAAAMGDVTVVEPLQSWGGDDFAWLTREVPGAYVRLGVHAAGTSRLDLHAGLFDVDERAISVGTQLLITTVLT